jgi:hypothetical protein
MRCHTADRHALAHRIFMREWGGGLGGCAVTAQWRCSEAHAAMAWSDHSVARGGMRWLKEAGTQAGSVRAMAKIAAATPTRSRQGRRTR